jgi:hypothetical protein
MTTLQQFWRGTARRGAALHALLLAVCFACVRAAKLHTCGRSALSSALAGDTVAWVRRAAKEPRYAHCKATSARYNCSRFDTSAAEYRVDWKPGTAADCALPSWARVLAGLQRAPLRVMLLGDSHTQQLYQAALCMFQAQARRIIAYTRTDDDTEKHASVYDSMAELPECHSVPYADYPRFHLDVSGAVGTSATACSLSHLPTTPSCFEVPLSAPHASGLTYSLVCAAYVRPLVGAAAVQAGLETGLASLNLSLSDFDVVAANTYISASALGAFLQASAFAGRVVTFPKFPNAGAQTGVRLTSDVLHSHVSTSAAAKFDVPAFCAAIVAAWGATDGDCTPVPFVRLMLQRIDDAKASIYPVSYVDAVSGTTKVCHASQGEATEHPERCQREGVFACVDTPCATESHFCMPGPPDDFALLVLAASI